MKSLPIPLCKPSGSGDFSAREIKFSVENEEELKHKRTFTRANFIWQQGLTQNPSVTSPCWGLALKTRAPYTLLAIESITIAAESLARATTIPVELLPQQEILSSSLELWASSTIADSTPGP